MSITSFLFRLARLSADTKAVASGDAKRVGRRAKNKMTGRLLGRAGFWRRLAASAEVHCRPNDGRTGSRVPGYDLGE